MRQSLAVKYRPKTFEGCRWTGYYSKILKRKKMVEPETLRIVIFLLETLAVVKQPFRLDALQQLLIRDRAPEEIDAASHNGVDDVRAIVEAGKQRAMAVSTKFLLLI